MKRRITSEPSGAPPQKRTRRSGLKDYQDNPATSLTVFVPGKGNVPKSTVKRWRKKNVLGRENIFMENPQSHPIPRRKKKTEQIPLAGITQISSSSAAAVPNSSIPDNPVSEIPVFSDVDCKHEGDLSDDDCKHEGDLSDDDVFIPEAGNNENFVSIVENEKMATGTDSLQGDLLDDDAEYLSKLFSEVSIDDSFQIPNLHEGIYPTSNLTIGLLLSIVVSRSTSEKWTQNQLNKELGSLMAMVPDEMVSEYKFPQNKSQFKKLFQSCPLKTKRHYFCRSHKCFCVDKEHNRCPLCQQECTEFIVTFDLNFLLQCTFRKKNFKEMMMYRYNRLLPNHKYSKKILSTHSFEDILDGKKVQEVDAKYPGFFSLPKNWANILYGVGFDGVPVIKVSGKSIWAMMAYNFCLPPSERYKHESIMLLGFFIGKQPPIQVFLDPFINPLLDWFNFGVKMIIENEAVTSKGALIFVDGDSKAREPARMHVSQGYHCCADCFIAGEYLGGSVKYHCPDETSFIQIERTHQNYLTDGDLFLKKELCMYYGEKSFETEDGCIDVDKGYVNGVYGISPFSRIPTIDLSESFPVQPMHLFYENLFPFIYELLFSKAYKACNFSARTNLSKIDDRIKAIHLPYGECNLKPMSDLFSIHGWKAHETRHFTLFNSVNVMKDLVDDAFLQNFADFVKYVVILSSDCISRAEIDKSEVVFKKFWLFFTSFFGKENVRLCCHQIIHIPKYVRLAGPLWTVSGFICENESGNWMRQVSGVSSSQDYMVFMYSVQLVMRTQDLDAVLIAQRDSIKRLLKKVCPALVSKDPVKGSMQIRELNGYTTYGAQVNFQLSLHHSKAVLSYFNSQKKVLKVLAGYLKMVTPFGIITAESFVSPKAHQKDSSCVIIKYQGAERLAKIILFFLRASENGETGWFALISLLSFENYSSLVDELGRMMAEPNSSELAVVPLLDIISCAIMSRIDEKYSGTSAVAVTKFKRPCIGDNFQRDQ